MIETASSNTIGPIKVFSASANEGMAKDVAAHLKLESLIPNER